MTRSRCGGWLIAMAAFAIVTIGCGPGGKKVVSVSGHVTRNGKPVPNVALHFEPATGRPSWGMTDADGKFTLKYTIDQEGAEVDTHKVWIEFPPASPQEENDLAMGKKKISAELKEMSKKYGDREKPAIEVVVTSDGKAIDIQLD